jgi:SAM-dependent methyltransferase
MHIEEFDNINALESTHWWYRGTREICFDAIDRVLTNRGIGILDIGCGTGGNMIELARYGHVEGLDLSPHCVELCRAKGLAVRTGDILSQELPPERYDLVTMFDVLSQLPPVAIPDAVRNVRRSLKPGALFAFRDPALAIAAGRHDLEVNVRKRFNRRFVLRLFEETGFEPVYITYLNTLLFLPIVIFRKVHLLVTDTPKSDVDRVSGILNASLLAILRVERALLRLVTLPFGVSLFVIGRRPK